MSWTQAEEASFAAIMESTGCNRAEAIRKYRAGSKSKPAPAKAAPKAAKKSKRVSRSDMPTTNHTPSPAMRVKIDAAIRKAVGAGAAVEARIGVRNSNGPQGAPYERYYLSNGHTCFVSGWHVGEPTVTVSEKKADRSSYTVKRYLDKQARAEKRLAKSEK